MIPVDIQVETPNDAGYGLKQGHLHMMLMSIAVRIRVFGPNQAAVDTADPPCPIRFSPFHQPERIRTPFSAANGGLNAPCIDVIRDDRHSPSLAAGIE
tara:strand:- start:194 stop:487 length:294 start_codon:yes stop_codon:yes gene_type:complete